MSFLFFSLAMFFFFFPGFFFFFFCKVDSRVDEGPEPGPPACYVSLRPWPRARAASAIFMKQRKEIKNYFFEIILGFKII